MISISQLYDFFKTCTGISTDTRQISDGCMFVALRGDNFDGNAYAAEALNKGANFVIVDRPEVVEDERFLLVNDSLVALQKLANHHRNQLKINIVGLTGSNGKTTTKELIAAVLNKKYKTYATRGNLNNHIGVPLTLLAIDESYEMAVVEMGANHQKEIELLCNIAEPTHGLITNVGKAHLEGFGGSEGVKKGKGEMYDFLAQSGGTVFVNASNVILSEMAAARQFKNRVDYLNDNSLTIRTDSPVVVYEDAHKNTITTYLTGIYNFENIATALAIGHYFGVDNTLANEAIAAYNPTNNRSQMIQKGSNMILMDAYNANPSSMAAAIENFARLDASHKMLILGDMFELGNEAATEHAELGKLIAKFDFNTVVLIGEQMANALKYLPSAYYFTDKFSLHNWLADTPQQNTAILIKGSRGMSLESTLQFL
jgi:UDP-N-acetylmuramoyl-tripeptide--D-alanyl-D-alanine ligase